MDVIPKENRNTRLFRKMSVRNPLEHGNPNGYGRKDHAHNSTSMHGVCARRNDRGSGRGNGSGDGGDQGALRSSNQGRDSATTARDSGGDASSSRGADGGDDGGDG